MRLVEARGNARPYKSPGVRGGSVSRAVSFDPRSDPGPSGPFTSPLRETRGANRRPYVQSPLARSETLERSHPCPPYLVHPSLSTHSHTRHVRTLRVRPSPYNLVPARGEEKTSLQPRLVHFSP